VLDRARELADKSSAAASLAPLSVALLFLAPSLRTRLGFAVAAVRLGGTPIEVPALRSTAEMSAAESFADTLRVASGMADIVIARTPFSLDRESAAAALASPCVNAGDGAEHPTQALIDLFAIESARGDLAGLRVCVCGDLTGRSARSLLKLLSRVLPRALTLVAPPGRDDTEGAIGAELASRTARTASVDFREQDVLYMAGLPEGTGEERLSEEARAEFALTVGRLGQLPGDSLVLAPMPVIDEIDAAARLDPRIGMFEQSDGGVPVRMAVLEHLCGGLSRGG
jgi:aspartate carbamoyltransferase catalytic subunit